MNRKTLITVITALISILFYSPATLADDCCPSDKAAHIDHKSTVDGYLLEYEFIDIKEKMKDMAEVGHSMGHTAATHHLMLYIKDADGQTVQTDKVGFLIVGPDGSEQKVMAMGMGGGHGADINLSKPGNYTVKSKAVAGDLKLIDSFNYSIK